MTSNDLDAFTAATTCAATSTGWPISPRSSTPEVIVNGTVHGLETYAEGLRSVIRVPDYRWELHHLVSDGGWIAAHLTDTGTHRGTFFDVSASGRAVTIEEFAFYRLAAGKIVEVWGMAFHLQLLEQLR